jgi:hypothetical protein
MPAGPTASPQDESVRLADKMAVLRCLPLDKEGKRTKA